MKRILTSLLCVLGAIVVEAAKNPNFIVIHVNDLGYTQTSVEMMTGRPESAPGNITRLRQNLIKYIENRRSTRWF